jgi:hypothetical protein
MPLYEYSANLHMHTPYSDGEWYHAQIAEAALRAGLDVICVTDHNVWVKGPERYYEKDGAPGKPGGRVLVLVGEEVHDQARDPQKNHLLVYGADRELARYAPEPQVLLDAAREAGALTFCAHPVDPAAPVFHEADLSWVSWEVSGFTGLEIWNYMSEFKSRLTSRANAVRHALNPEQGINGPFPETLAKWDALTTAGRRVVGIGNADAHGTTHTLGGLKRVIFPYEFLFRAVNTHILTETPLTGDLAADKRLALGALAQGHCFVGYDGAAPTKGFRFTANSERGNALMGDEVVNKNGVTLQIAAPVPVRGSSTRTTLRLICNGKEIVRRENQSHYTHLVPAGQTGVFRVEAHCPFQGRTRGWIFSNPIYVRSG